MNLTTKGKYAVTAALDLAIYEKQAVFLKIAEKKCPMNINKPTINIGLDSFNVKNKWSIFY